ncbi:MAG: glucosamine-6-phosphate deaminase [Clostridia bacterium]|nr:glucosamine-6-phosphate deaminase [Clostridia bacterium]
MKILVVKNYEEMSARAAEIFAAQIKSKPDSVLGLATGSTPEGLYGKLAEANARGEVDFAAVRTVNLDEYYPISPENDQSYRYFMNKQLFDRVNIDKANTMVPDGTAKDTDAFCQAYEEKIDAMGGIDMQLLGIGRNGHIGFNEPDGELIPFTHLTALTPSTIVANARFFASEADVPKHALTMGIQSVFKAKKVVMLASGKDKADAVKAMLNGNLNTRCPASLLRLHPDVTVICDEDAYSLVK